MRIEADARGTGSVVGVKFDGADQVASAVRTSSDVSRATAGIDHRGVSFEVDGSSPRGEDGALATTLRLIERLNAHGGEWTGVAEVFDGAIDCMAASGDRELRVQVTRIAPADVWKELGERQHTTRVVTAESLADEVSIAVQRKAAMLPSHERAQITLALDAGQIPAHALPAVVDAYRARYTSATTTLGFSAVWIVGPVAALVARLDTP